MELHKIEIKNRDPGQWAAGHNVAILIDGVELQGVSRFNLEVLPGQLAVATIEILADFSVHLNDGRVELEQQEKDPFASYDIVNGAGEVVGKVKMP